MKGLNITNDQLDKNVYEPYLVETGVTVDPKYKEYMEQNKVLKDNDLKDAGKKFLTLHQAQFDSVKSNPKKISDRKSFRNKAFVESILCGWSYVAGLLQTHKERLLNHFVIPKTTSKIPDPLNAFEMSQFKHDQDPPTYRGLGTRSSPKDRQRMAQVFLAKSLKKDCILDKKFLNSAVSQVIGIQTLYKGYRNV